MRGSNPIKLVLFFTYGVSLQTWDQTGILEREVMLYRRLLEKDIQVSFVTYGFASDLAYANRLPGIQILCNQWKLPLRLYSRLIPWLHGRSLKQATIFKSNQTEGAAAALWAKRIFGKKMIARAGFLWSLYLSQLKTTGEPPPKRAKAILQRERQAFSQADRTAVTTTLMKNHIAENYGVPLAKINVIPNFTLTDIFIPASGKDASVKPRLIYVGRLSPEKNLPGLLEAIAGLEVELTIIGDGPQRQELQEKAARCGLEVTFLGNQPHHELPKFLNQADLFILPSISEGHPKVLLEAMACGLPVIGTKTPGIQALIRHRETGYLCGTAPAAIRAAIQEMIGNAELRHYLGHKGREFVIQNFSLDKIVELELNLLTSLAQDLKDEQVDGRVKADRL